MNSDEGLTVTLALCAGFAIGRSPALTTWWQYLVVAVIIAVIIAVFLTRLLTRSR